MRLFLLGLLGIAAAWYQLSLQGVYLFGDPLLWPLRWPGNGVPLEPAWLTLLSLLLGFWVAFEGVLQIRRSEKQQEQKEQAAPKVEPDESFRIELKASLHKKDQTISALNNELEALQRNVSELQRAYDETSTELAESRKKSPLSVRSGQIDAELSNLLAVLQEKGRFLDFLMDDISAYPDPQVGAASRIVHQGCQAVIQEFFTVQAVHPGTEGATVTLEKGYPGKSYRLLGKVQGEPPFKGKLVHHGWKVTEIRLPRVVSQEDTAEHVVAPAEVEIG